MYAPGIDRIGCRFFGKSLASLQNIQWHTKAGEKPSMHGEPRIDFDNSVIVNESEGISIGSGVPIKNMRRGTTDHAYAINGAKKERYHEGDMRELGRKNAAERSRDVDRIAQKQIENAGY